MWRDGAQVLLVAATLALFVRVFLVQAYRIPSESMEPTLVVGDHLLINKFIFGAGAGRWGPFVPQREVRPGDLVTFRGIEDPAQELLKRCVATAGAEVEIDSKKLRVNGRRSRRNCLRRPLGRPGLSPVGVPSREFLAPRCVWSRTRAGREPLLSRRQPGHLPRLALLRPRGNRTGARSAVTRLLVARRGSREVGRPLAADLPRPALIRRGALPPADQAPAAASAARAASGSAAWVSGRPITMRSAPDRSAAAGVATRR